MNNKRKFLILVFLLIFHSTAFGNVRTKVIKNAVAELGNGELGGNNKGKYVRLYNQGMESSWCAGFVSYILQKSGYNELGYEVSSRRIYNEAKKLGLVTNEPKPGYLIMFWRESPSSWKGHIGIIIEVNGNVIKTIEGNKGKYPAKVRICEYDKNNIPKLLGYIKIKEMIGND